MTPVHKEKEVWEEHRRDGTKVQQVTCPNTREDYNKFSESGCGDKNFLTANEIFPAYILLLSPSEILLRMCMTSAELVYLGKHCPRVRLHVLDETETHIRNSVSNSLPVALFTAICERVIYRVT